MFFWTEQLSKASSYSIPSSYPSLMRASNYGDFSCGCNSSSSIYSSWSCGIFYSDTDGECKSTAM